MQFEWNKINAFLQDKKTILVTTHLNPDGDAIGSQMALAFYLERIGKEVVLINSDPAPKFFHFLDQENKIQVYSHDLDSLIQSFDGIIIVDVSEWKRLGRIGDVLKQSEIPVACIDHHLSSIKISDAQIIDQYASSTGELVYDFLLTNEAEFTQNIIDALYTCILTDTGSFRFSNTTARTHQITADLLIQGARFKDIYSIVYESNSKNRTWLMGELLAKMNFECDDRVAWFVMSQELLQKTGATLDETEGFSELSRTIQTVEISVMFTEPKQGMAKASFRSKGRVPINELAAQFGGGGHKFASGAALSMPLDQAIALVIPVTVQYFKKMM